jgi:hypothetical protein
MAVLQCPELLRYCKIDKDLLREQLCSDQSDSQMDGNGEFLRELEEELHNS